MPIPLPHPADLKDAVEYLTRFPEILTFYSKFSYVLLAILGLGGIAIVIVHWFKQRASGEGLPFLLVLVGCLLGFTSGGGIVLKWNDVVNHAKRIDDFKRTHRVPDGKYGLLVFDFSEKPQRLSDQEYKARMGSLVDAITEVLLEDIPEGFAQPRIQEVSLDESPWTQGVNASNAEETLEALNASEVVWGRIQGQGETVQAFLGLPQRYSKGLHKVVVPLREFAFNEDPRKELRFKDGYYRLLGLTLLGMALDNFEQAKSATGEERKTKFLATLQLLNRTRTMVSNRREDTELSDTVFSKTVDELVNVAFQETGLAP